MSPASKIYLDGFKPGADYKPQLKIFYDGAPIPYPDNQLCIERNPRFNEGLGKHNTAFVVVHAGFIDYTIDNYQETGKRLHPLDEVFFSNMAAGNVGDYYKHRENLGKLTEQLAQTKAPVIYAVEQHDATNPNIPLNKLQPPDNAFVLVTYDSSGDPIENINTVSDQGLDKTDQQPGMLFHALKQSGVTNVLMAGELSFNSPRTPACLGGLAERFMDHGFNVHGIEGAVYPTKEPSFILSGKAVRKALYRNSIPLNELPLAT